MRVELPFPLSLDEIQLKVKGRKNYTAQHDIYAVCTDTRLLKKGDLFIALTGKNDSGENHLAEAKKREAVIISQNSTESHIAVADTELALLKVAVLYIEKITSLKERICISGSVGKTTAKNILGLFLKSSYKTHITEKNENNIIGVSYTLLKTPKDTEILVLEIGMNHLFEIEKISKEVKPTISVITNIGTAHIGNIGSRNLIAKAKLELLCGMEKPLLIVPHEEPLLSGIKGAYTVSDESPDASLYLSNIVTEDDGVRFDVTNSEKNTVRVFLKTHEKSIMKAASMALAVADILKLGAKDIYRGIESINSNFLFKAPIRVNDFYILDDSYNSSAESVICAIENLKQYKGCFSAVLGDMLELGGMTEQLHRKIGEFAAKSGVRKIYTFGVYGIFIKQGAVGCGMNPADIFSNDDITDPEITARQIIQNHTEGETILIKASHRLKAHRIADLITQFAGG